MTWPWKRKDPIPVEAKVARVQADLAALQAETSCVEAEQALKQAQTVARALSEIRRKNHFADALRFSIGGAR